MPLKRFVIAKKDEIARLQKLAEHGALPSSSNSALSYKAERRQDFILALQKAKKETGQVAIIAEYKRASPSRGIICQSVSVEDAVVQYTASGATAISILTEERYFQGELAFLQRAHEAPIHEITTMHEMATLPLLRKDFIFDPLQVHETAMSPASALLLIVRLTPDAKVLRELRELAESYGMHAVVEIFNADELIIARQSGARIIQVNARDLHSFEVDTAACISLAKRYKDIPSVLYHHRLPEKELWIAASGIQEPWQIHEAAEAGYDAVLIGSALMENGQPGQALHQLLQGYKEQYHGEESRVL